MRDGFQIDGFGDGVEDLGAAFAAAQGTMAAFAGALREVQSSLGDTVRDLGKLEKGFSVGLRRAFDGLVFDGMKLSEALAGVGRAMLDTVYAAALRPVTDHLGGLLARGLNAAVAGAIPLAGGAPFSQGRVMPFARGGIVSGATPFPMRGGGIGLMGEAGPEAIMPLARGADGRLGVRAQAGGNVHVTMHVTTPDVASFARSRTQIAAELARAVARGQRNR
jgi:hypothetical protein